MKLMGRIAIVCALLASIFVLGCGGSDDSGATQAQLDAAKQEGIQQAKQQAKLDALQAKVDQLAKQGQNKAKNAAVGSGANQEDTSGLQGAGPTTACGGGVSAGANTTCVFAMNVAGEYGSNPGATSIRAYSEATGQYYRMSCTTYGAGHVCTGGNGAAVYLP